MIIQTRDLKKSYSSGEQTVHALKGISVSISKGEFVSIMGPSGSGKSTFLHLLGGLDKPTDGTVQFESQNIELFDDQKLSEFRRRKLGFIFQFFNLLPTLSAIENVMLPSLLDGKSKSQLSKKAYALLEAVGLHHRALHRPNQLSGGEMQRVAIARALIADPLLILADEPTGNLDTNTGQSILELLRNFSQKHQQTVVMVTHDSKAASYGTRLLRLRDGLLESDEQVLASTQQGLPLP